MENRVILLVEDNARDEALTLRALKKCNIVNKVVVARDGVAALDYLFATRKYAGRDTRVMPQFILLDLKLPKMPGLQVLKKIRADKRTKRLPVVVFTSSIEEEDLIKSHDLGANSFVRKPIDPEQFLDATRQLGLYWTVLNQPARILVIDQHDVVRAGVKRILDDPPGTRAFGDASSAPEALKLVRQQGWDVAVLALSLGGRGGLDVLKEMKRIRPKLPVLIFSDRSDEYYAPRAFKAGAAGFVSKDSSSAELVKAVTKVAGGGRYVSSALAEKLVVDFEGGRPAHQALSDREFEVMRLIASGKTVGEIAGLLSLSDKTISTYRARLLGKMGMKNNAELTHYAIQNELVD